MRRLKNTVDVNNAVEVARAGGVVSADTSSPEHYHLTFQVAGEEAVIPHFGTTYQTQRAAFAAVKEFGDNAEPNTEWGEDGRILIETRLQGRTGLFRLIIGVMGCIATKCQQPNSTLILPHRRN